jgi:hypothetical protein
MKGTMLDDGKRHLILDFLHITCMLLDIGPFLMISFGFVLACFLNRQVVPIAAPARHDDREMFVVEATTGCVRSPDH